MKNAARKLTLSQEALRQLTEQELQSVAGGFLGTSKASYCCPTFTCIYSGENE
jgi:hypothetical protein